jgi:GxxExxY protein
MPLLEEFKYTDITRKIIGCAMSVHSYLGNGYQEIIYQRALAYEFQQVHLNFERELEMDIFYKDMIEPLGTRRVDFLGRFQSFGAKLMQSIISVIL